ncbi:hypothetical protein JL721_3562 [Aureococcus anophagefferens]|nr:hypothetical protein JL721_3562 [Aureococcus anophagefferens]
MIARRNMSRNEWETTERGASKVGKFALFPAQVYLAPSAIYAAISPFAGGVVRRFGAGPARRRLRGLGPRRGPLGGWLVDAGRQWAEPGCDLARRSKCRSGFFSASATFAGLFAVLAPCLLAFVASDRPAARATSLEEPLLVDAAFSPESSTSTATDGGGDNRTRAGSVAKRADEPTEHDGDTDDDGVADDDADGAALVARVPGPS